MLSHPRWKAMLALALTRRIPAIHVCRCWMANYGHFSAKPTLLWGDMPHLRCLRNQLSASLRAAVQETGSRVTKKYLDATGKRRCAGGPLAM